MGKNFNYNQSGVLILLFLSVFLLAAAGEDSANHEVELFNKGYESYLSYQPEKAVQEFTSFLKEFPDSSARDAALYWLGKSYIQMKSFGDARRVFVEIKQNFPGSPYLSHAETELAIISTSEIDAHMGMEAETGMKNESPEKRLKEAEKKGKMLEKSLRETAEERDRLRGKFNEEEKRTEALREQVKQLEKKEKTLNDVAGERDELRRKLDEEKKRIKKLETITETCEDDAKKLRSGEKELTETIKEKDSLKKQLDEERKTTADLLVKLKEIDKKEKTIKELIEESDALKTQVENDKKQIGELQENLKKIGDKDDIQKQIDELEKKLGMITQERDTLSRMLGEERKKTDELRVQTNEMEKTEKTTTQPSEEKEQLMKQLDEEKQKTATVMARIAELEEKELVVAEVIQERDALKSKVEEQMKLIEDLSGRRGDAGTQAPPPSEAAYADKEVKTQEDREKKTEEVTSPKGKERGEIEPSSDSTASVLHQLGIQEVPWRSGNSKEDEETEKVLYEKARSLNVTGDEKKLKDLAAKHAFNAQQRDYLERYLAVSEYIDRRLKSIPDEEVIELLVVTYEEENRYTKIVLATELQENARQGEPFEEIYKLYPDMIVYKIIPSQQLEKQIRDKISSLAHGEIGIIWSKDGYMILKPSLKKLSYEPFHNFTPETKERIKTLVNGWVQELKSP